MICDPALTALFTPLHPRVGRYEVCVTPDSIEQVVADRPPDAGRHTYSAIETLDPLEAFGGAGPYDRFAVARLYRGQRVRVAHGWREEGGRFESVTLVSPYPDASLTRLMPGTMMIRVIYPPTFFHWRRGPAGTPTRLPRWGPRQVAAN